MTDCSAFLSWAQNFFVHFFEHFECTSNLQWLLWLKNQMHRLFFSRQDSIVTMDVPVKSFSRRNSIHSKNLSNFQNLIPSNLFDLRLSVQKLLTGQPPKNNESKKVRKSAQIEWTGGYLRLLVLNLVAVRLKLANVLQNLILLVRLLLIFDFLRRRLELDRNSFHVLSLLNDVGNVFHNIDMLKKLPLGTWYQTGSNSRVCGGDGMVKGVKD